MIRTVRALFLGRLLREKLLVVAFIAIGLLIWLSSFSSRAGSFWRAQASTASALREQERWLGRREAIQTAAEKAAANLDPAQTLDGTRLYSKVLQLARDAGLRSIQPQGQAENVSNGQFSQHTMGFSITNTDWEALKKFYVSLHENSPYLGITQFVVLPSNARNPALLSVSLKVSSIEIAR